MPALLPRHPDARRLDAQDGSVSVGRARAERALDAVGEDLLALTDPHATPRVHEQVDLHLAHFRVRDANVPAVRGPPPVLLGIVPAGEDRALELRSVVHQLGLVPLVPAVQPVPRVEPRLTDPPLAQGEEVSLEAAAHQGGVTGEHHVEQHPVVLHHRAPDRAHHAGHEVVAVLVPELVEHLVPPARIEVEHGADAAAFPLFALVDGLDEDLHVAVLAQVREETVRVVSDARSHGGRRGDEGDLHGDSTT